MSYPIGLSANRSEVKDELLALLYDGRQPTHSFSRKYHWVHRKHRKRLTPFRDGDKVTFYVSRETFRSQKPVHKLMGLATVRGRWYTSDKRIWDNGVFPCRININLLSESSCEIAPLVPKLTFIKNKRNWGITFMGGIVKVPETDFALIAENLNCQM